MQKTNLVGQKLHQFFCETFILVQEWKSNSTSVAFGFGLVFEGLVSEMSLEDYLIISEAKLFLFPESVR